MKSYKELKKAISFDIFDEEKVKEVIANPDGSKYPLALFKFYENGTIDDIQLPSNMDEYNAHTIIELIEDVIPKLTRNRTEDISNGLEIKNKKGKKNNTLVESHSPRELEEFRDSKFSKSVERVIENEQLKSIKSDTSFSLETKLREGETSFGLQSFDYDQKSKIISTLTKDDKENVESIMKLTKHFTLINSKDLMESFSKKKENGEEYVIKDLDEKEVSKLRKLLPNGDATVTIANVNIAGRQVLIQARFGCSGGAGFAYIKISCGGNFQLGTSGVQGSKSWSGSVTLFTFPFGPTGIFLNLKVGGSVTVSLSADWQGSAKITLSASLYADGEVAAGSSDYFGVSGGVRGTFLTGTLNGNINTSGGVSKSCSFNAGKLSAFVKGNIVGKEAFNVNREIFGGWNAGCY